MELAGDQVVNVVEPDVEVADYVDRSTEHDEPLHYR
jgi:hypothetical protein